MMLLFHQPGSWLLPCIMGMVIVASLSSCSSYEAGAEWETLFDGSSTELWRAYGRDSFPSDGWVVDGTALKTVPGGDVVDIISASPYERFELTLEWRVSPGGNSGIFLYASEESPSVWHNAPEIQVLDDELHADGANPRTSAGSLYDLIPPGQKVLKPVGEYNEVRIVADGPILQHWLNGIMTFECDLDSAEFQALVEESKFSAFEQFAGARRGHIVLQHHGEEVWYRNIRIRKLPAS